MWFWTGGDRMNRILTVAMVSLGQILLCAMKRQSPHTEFGQLLVFLYGQRSMISLVISEFFLFINADGKGLVGRLGALLRAGLVFFVFAVAIGRANEVLVVLIALSGRNRLSIDSDLSR